MAVMGRFAGVGAVIGAACVTALLASSSVAAAASTTQVDHVVVLMMENRAFDHMVGLLSETNPNINGCKNHDTRTECSNPADPSDPTSKRTAIDNLGVYVQPQDPSHSVNGTHFQMFGEWLEGMDVSTAVPPMDGFVANYELELRSNKSVPANMTGDFIMHSFDPKHVPIISMLAQEFAIFDAWHAGVPGPTEVNRCFALSATSNGMAKNDAWKLAFGMPQKTIFETLDNAGRNWSVYFEDFPASLFMAYTRGHLGNFHTFDTFKQQAAAGDLPAFSWVEPRYYDDFGKAARDQHPNHDVAAGEAAMKEIYEALRSSPKWNNTALLITYDEHGGFFDHVPPPTCVNPDGKVSTDPPFNFTRLGIRVPAVLVSPLIQPGTVIHGGADNTVFEHASIPATLRNLFAPSEPFLNQRDAHAASFDGLFGSEPRSDCPLKLPQVLPHRGLTPLPPLDGRMPLTDLQKGFLVTAASLNGDMIDSMDALSEGEGARLVADHVNKFFGRKLA